MTDYKTTEARRRANRNWEKRNRKKATIDNYRRNARLFIREHATKEELEELKEIIEEKLKNA